MCVNVWFLLGTRMGRAASNQPHMDTHQHKKSLKNGCVGHEEQVFIGSFEVQPVDSRKHRWKGAFVFCYVAACDSRAAAKLIRTALKEDGYRVIRQEYCRRNRAVEWERAKDQKRASALAAKALKSGDVVYDEFYCYERN